MSEFNNVSLRDLSDNDLSKIIGLTVDVNTNTLKGKITGSIFSVIKETNTLILIQNPEKNKNIYNSVIINMDSIEDIQLASDQDKINVDDFFSPNFEKIKEEELKRINKEKILRTNQREAKEISKLGLALYDKLSKIYKCNYTDNKLILEELDAWISAPFTTSDIYCDDEFTKKRITKMIESCKI